MKFLFERRRSVRAATRAARAWPRVAALMLLTLIVACESPEEKEARHYERGLQLYEEGQDEKAMVEFRNVIRLNPKNADVIYHFGLIHERAGRIPQARAAFHDATIERPEFVDAQIKYGTYALGAGNVESAERAAKAIEKVEPGHPEALALQGAIALRKGEYQAATDSAKAALAREPQNEHAVAVLVGVQDHLGEYKAALARLEEALAAHPESVSLRALKIAILEKTGDAKGLVATYQEISALEPDDVDYRLALAGFHYNREEFAEAEVVLRQAMNDGLSGSEINDALVQLLYEQRGFAAAEAELRSLIERDSQNYPLRFRLADLYIREGQPEEAEHVLAAVIEEAEEVETVNDARVARARIRLDAGDVEGARGLVEDTLAEAADHPEANLLRGRMLLAQGELDGAMRSVRTALHRDPTWLPALRFLAEVHLAKGEADLAIDALGRALNSDSTDIRSAELLGTLLTQRGDYETALKIWDQIVRFSEDPSHALRVRADIEIRRGHFSAAEADIGHLLKTPGQALAGALLKGKLLLAQNRYEESRGWFAKASTLDPEASGPVIALARSHLAEGNVDAAIAYLDRRTREQRDDALAFYMKGGFLAQQGKLDEAEAAFREAIRLQPEASAPYRLLGRVLLQGGEAAKALGVYEAALEQRPDDPGLLSELAERQYRAGKPKDAIATYARLLELKPDLDTAANNYAALVADFAYQDPEELKHALDVALRFRGTESADLLDTLGWLYYRKGDFSVAATFLERAVILAPENPQFQYHLGAVLQRTGQEERAVAALMKAVAADDADYPGFAEARTMLKMLQAEPTPAPLTSG